MKENENEAQERDDYKASKGRECWIFVWSRREKPVKGRESFKVQVDQSNKTEKECAAKKCSTRKKRAKGSFGCGEDRERKKGQMKEQMRLIKSVERGEEWRMGVKKEG